MNLVLMFTGEEGLCISLQVCRTFSKQSLPRTMASVPTGNSKMYDSIALMSFGFQILDLINCN